MREILILLIFWLFWPILARKTPESRKIENSLEHVLETTFYTPLVQILGSGNNLVLRSYFLFYDFLEIACEIWLNYGNWPFSRRLTGDISTTKQDFSIL